MTNHYYLTIATLCALLAGCGSPEIDAVKKSGYPADPTHTYDTALSQRGACSHTSWKSSKDDSNRQVVEYRCELKNATTAVQAVRDSALAESNDLLQANYQAQTSQIEDLKRDEAYQAQLIQEKKAVLQKTEADLQQKQAMMDGPSWLRAKQVAEEYKDWDLQTITQAERRLEDLTSGKAAEQLNQSFKSKTLSLQATIQATHRKYDGVKSVTEVIRWIVKGQNVTPTYYGFEIDSELGQKNSNQTDPLRFAFALRQIVLKRGEDYVTLIAPELLKGVTATTDKVPEFKDTAMPAQGPAPATVAPAALVPAPTPTPAPAPDPAPEKTSTATPAVAHTACAGSKAVFACTTTKGKTVEVCDSGESLTYSFGKPGEKPDMELSVQRAKATTFQWDGRGNSINYSVQIPNSKTIYEVFTSTDRMSDQHTMTAGINVEVSGKHVATLPCQADTVVNGLEGISLKAAAWQ